MRVGDGSTEVMLDLGAEPIAFVDSPVSATLGTHRIQVDTVHEILVNKLCALLSRSEIRDLVAVEAFCSDAAISSVPVATLARRTRGSRR